MYLLLVMKCLKAITNFVEKQSNPLFNQAIDHTQAQGLTEETNDSQIYEHYIELQNLKESLTTKIINIIISIWMTL